MRKVFSLCFMCSICGMLFFLYQNNFFVFLIFLSITPITLILNYFDINRLNDIKKLKPKTNSISIKKIKYSPIELIDKLIVDIPLIKKIYDYSIKHHIKTFECSGSIIRSEAMAKETVSLVLLSLVGSVVFIIFAYTIYPNILLLIILCIPVMIFIQRSVLGINDIINNRVKQVEDELLFFIVFCDIIDNTQSNILKAFQSLLDESFNVFPAIKKESIFIQREIEWFGKSVHEVFVGFSATHPSKNFSDFILGYITNEDIGGRKTGNYFETKINELYELKNQKLESYSYNAQMVAPIGVFILSMIPMFLVIFSIFQSGDIILLLVVSCVVLVPIIMIVVIRKIESMIPLINDKIPFRKEPIIVATITLFVCAVLQLMVWEIVAYPLIVWSITNHIISQKIISSGKNFELAIPRFVNELNQMMLSWSFFHSFKILAKKQQHNKEFNLFLDEVYNRVDSGESMDEVLLKIKINSWISRLIIQLISFTTKTGTINHHTMKKLSELSQKWIEVKTKMMSATIMALILAYISPLLALLMIILIPTFSISEQINSVSDYTNVSVNDSITDNLINMNYVLLFIIAFFGTVNC